MGVNLRSIVDTLVGSKVGHINVKKDGTANRFGSAVPSSFWLVISVPLGDTFGAFDASLDIREDQHDVVQFIG